MKLKIQMSKVKIIFLVILIHFFSIQTVLAACPSNNTDVPSNDDILVNPNQNHTYTGNDCSAIRGPAGSIIGPSQFGDPQFYRCLGACKYMVNYCTKSGCEANYPDGGPNQCSSAPAQCSNPNTTTQTDVGKIFGKIDAPQAIQNFGFGAVGISKLLSNIIQLMYIGATIVLIFMILWGAWDWMTSEGDKEKLSAAQRKLINAFVGIVLFAAAFAIIQVLGQFTGFTFFAGQK